MWNLKLFDPIYALHSDKQLIVSVKNFYLIWSCEFNYLV